MVVRKATILKVYSDKLQNTILKYVRSFVGDFPFGILSTTRLEEIDGYTTFEVYPNQVRDKQIRELFELIPEFNSSISFVEVYSESI